jgi:hypothetical protein
MGYPQYYPGLWPMLGGGAPMGAVHQALAAHQAGMLRAQATMMAGSSPKPGGESCGICCLGFVVIEESD